MNIMNEETGLVESSTFSTFTSTTPDQVLRTDAVRFVVELVTDGDFTIKDEAAIVRAATVLYIFMKGDAVA